MDGVPGRRRHRWLLPGLVGLALAVRLLPATIHFVVGTDEAAYLTLAQHLAAGQGYTLDGVRPHTEFDPGYPLLAALVYRLGGGLVLPAQLNLVLGGLVVVPVFWLAHALYDGTTARRAALFTALLPALVLGAPNFGASSEQVYTLCLWLGLAALWHGRGAAAGRALGSFALAGAALGWAHLTRWEGAIYLTVGLGWIAWDVCRGHHRLRSLGGLGAFALAFGLVAVPYALYLQSAQGTWFSSKGTTQQLQGLSVAGGDPLAWERYYDAYEQARDSPSDLNQWARELWANRSVQVWLYARNWLSQLSLPFRSLSFLAWLWIPLVPWAWFRRPRARDSNAFLVTALAPLALFPVAFVDARYWLPLTPGLLIWAAAGAPAAGGWLRRRVAWAHRRLITAALAVAFVVASTWGAYLVPAPTEYRALGEWMSAHGIGQGEIVLARKRQVPFYAGARWEWLPFTDTAGLLDYAAQRRASYVVIDERTVPRLRPELTGLLHPAQAPAQLELAVQLTVRHHDILLYRLKAQR